MLLHKNRKDYKKILENVFKRWAESDKKWLAVNFEYASLLDARGIEIPKDEVAINSYKARLN